MTPQPTSKFDDLRRELESALSGVESSPSPDAKGIYEGIVAGTSGDDVFLELGPRVQGVVARKEFGELPETGTKLRVALRGKEEGLWLFSTQEARKLAAWDDMEIGSLVKGKVIGLNKGGLELKVDGISAFLPSSQIDVKRVEDTASYAGQTLVCQVLEIDRAKRRVVVSRRAVLEEEREQKHREAAQELVEGGVVRGKVRRLESFGAFVEITPGIEGLLHVSNIAHKRVERPEEVLKIGQEVEVQILKIEEGGRRIGLGMKQLEADPWDEVEERLQVDQVVQGKVVRLANYGAFVELMPGIDGLVHVSQIGPGRIFNVRDAVAVGEEVPVRILELDSSARRISLSRLDPRGALLGSDEAIDEEEMNQLLNETPSGSLGTNLGSLFKKAIDTPDA